MELHRSEFESLTQNVVPHETAVTIVSQTQDGKKDDHFNIFAKKNTTDVKDTKV